MNFPKIQLSSEELVLVQDAGILLTKNRIIEKVYTLFGEFAATQLNWFECHPYLLSPELLQLSPKIAKGEKYKGLPYVMLDYPRCFGKENIFAVRTFFWWGNYFSVTLHLKGKYQQLYVPLIQKKNQLLAETGFRLSISGDEWEQDINSSGFSSLDKKNSHLSSVKISEAYFYRLSCPVAFSNWNEMKEILVRLHQVIYKAITG